LNTWQITPTGFGKSPRFITENGHRFNMAIQLKHEKRRLRRVAGIVEFRWA
jgi:hypothetical protein